ncbi:MAG TPA: hypothetical protein VHO68_02890, partial [Bacteroidales bacterium]|nr:hypothetical protein [Bacteroidales bacterium]
EENIFRDYVSGMKLVPGSYRLRVRDVRGCEALKPEIVIITKPDQKLAFTAELKSYNGFNVSCHGNNDGEMTISAYGGNGYGYDGYDYILAERPDQTGNNYKGLAAGTYNITVKDGRGCRTTGNAVLTEPPATIGLQLSSFRNPVCSYDSNGEVSLLASGGVEPYSWSVNNGQFMANSRFTGLGTGNYIFRVRDVNGCGNELEKALASNDGEMLISGLVSDARCFGENSGSIRLQTSGGSLPYSYSWNGLTLTGPFAERLGKGDYNVVVTDSAGCRSQKSFHIGEPLAALSLNAVTKPACVGLKDGEIQLTAAGGTSPYMYALGKASDFSAGNIFHVRSGSHKLYASDINGCLTSAEVEIGVRNVLPDQNFMIATSRYELDTLVVIDVSVPRPDRTVWEFSPEASVIDTSSSIARVKYNMSGIYPVNMTGWFSDCVYTAEKLVNIAPFDPFAKEQDKYHKGIKNVRLLPNPNDGHFRLEVDLYTREQINIKIFDYDARMIFDEKFPACTLLNQEINLKDDLHPGTYYLWVICEDDARTQPFIISR